MKYGWIAWCRPDQACPARRLCRQKRYSAGYRVEYYAGYGNDKDDVPNGIKEALKLAVTALYEQRVMNPNELPPEAKMMLTPFRVRNL